LETVANLPLQELLVQSSAYGINYIIHLYFENVDQPEDGDLVVYESSKTLDKWNIDIDAGKSTHAGIYRKSKPNWNSPFGGTIESKWSWWSNPYVFQHDVFFVPDFIGDSAKFYRLKKQAPLVSLKADPNKPTSPMFAIEDSHFCFKRTEENAHIRQEIDNTFGLMLSKKFPQIKKMEHIRFFGVCYHYAFGKILKTYSIPSNTPIQEEMKDYLLNKYFVVTTEPSEGDLAVYYQILGYPIHYGIYKEEGIIESKWGSGAVYQHPPFYVPNEYGDILVYYKIKPEFTSETLLKALQQKPS
jgi:hypothetical protein